MKDMKLESVDNGTMFWVLHDAETNGKTRVAHQNCALLWNFVVCVLLTVYYN